MTVQNKFIWNAIQVICWIIFVGLCIQTGALLFNYVYSIFKPVATYNLYNGLNLAALYKQSKFFYGCIFSSLIIISTLKAYIFYLVLKIFKTLNLTKPFSEKVSTFISQISYQAFWVGFLSLIAQEFTKKIWLKGFDVSDVSNYWDDGFAFLMMAAILFVIAQIFKKGIELQTEQDLTV
jgi:Protein of unknown function (DUF2975)